MVELGRGNYVTYKSKCINEVFLSCRCHIAGDTLPPYCKDVSPMTEQPEHFKTALLYCTHLIAHMDAEQKYRPGASSCNRQRGRVLR